MSPPSPPLESFMIKYCRMCATEVKQGVFIFGDEGKRLQLPEKIRTTVNILVLEEDTLPKKICTDCCSNLENYSHFKSIVSDAQEKLTAIAKKLDKVGQKDKQKKKKKKRQESPSILEKALAISNVTEADAKTDVEEQEGTEQGQEEGQSTNTSEVIIVSEGQGQGQIDEGRGRKEKERVLQCGICDVGVPSKEELVSHHESSHDKSKYPNPVYGCSFCHRISERYDPIRQHINRHLNQEKYKCTECERTFPIKSMLDRHMEAAHCRNGKPYYCKECGQGFTAKCSLISHGKLKHEGKGVETEEEDEVEDDGTSGFDEVLPTQEPVGGCDSGSPPNLSSPPALQNDPGPVRQPLSQDNSPLIGKQNSPQEQQPQSQGNGKSPENPTLEPDIGKWRCKECDKEFITKKGYELHIASHINYRLKCDYCDKTFTQKHSLKYHIRARHQEHADEIFKCEICSKEFMCKKLLQQHGLYHVRPEDEVECSYCGGKYRSAHHLKNHIKNTHASKLNFPCKDCSKRFPNKSKLAIHENVHKKNVKLKCPHCDHVATSNSGFYLHIRSHGGKKRKRKKKQKDDGEQEGEGVKVGVTRSTAMDNNTSLQDLTTSKSPQKQGQGQATPTCTIIPAHSTPINYPTPSNTMHPMVPVSSLPVENHQHGSMEIQTSTTMSGQTMYNSVSSHQNWNNTTTSVPRTSYNSGTGAFDLVEVQHPSFDTITIHAPTPTYAHTNNLYSSTPNQQQAHTTTIMHTSPTAAHCLVSPQSNMNHLTGLGGNQNYVQAQSEPMELSYKLHLDNGQGLQDMPMELCVRQEFNPLMDLSSRGMDLNTIPMNMNNNNINCMGMGSYHKDLAERELTFNDLSGAFRQPIDLIARPEDNGADLCSEGSLVDLSLRSTFQDQSSFLRELIDLSSRSESFHGEINLTNKQSQGGSGGGAGSGPHHQGGKGSGTTNNNAHGQGTSSSHNNNHLVVYQDTMFL